MASGDIVRIGGIQKIRMRTSDWVSYDVPK